MKNMLPAAVPTNAELDAFTRAWLGNWLTAQTINGFVVPARTAMASIIDNWPKIPGTAQLDLDKAPFRLLAIVNRMDLRNGTGAKQAGEGRFVFALLDSSGQAATSNPSQWPTFPRPFVAILEYNLPVVAGSDAVIHDVAWWAERWHELGALALPSAAFNDKLAQITDAFSGRIAPSTSFPNGHALAQLRTNEIALASPWELREFVLRAAADGTRQLGEVTTKQTPDMTFNDLPAKRAQLVAWMTTNKAAVLAAASTIPDTLPDGTPFLSGSALSPTPNFTWLEGETTAPAGFTALEWETAKRNLGTNTCNGCHTGEQNDPSVSSDGNTPFLHIAPRAVGTAAATSRFIRVTDMPNRKLMHFRALGCGSATDAGSAPNGSNVGTGVARSASPPPPPMRVH